MSQFHSLNVPQIIYEEIDDEVIIINMLTGNYYSLDGVGKRIWELVDAGASIADIHIRLSNEFDKIDSNLEEQIKAFLDELITEGLVQPTSEPATKTNLNGIQKAKYAYAAPKLNAFTDMQDLLLLDPIHDVDETGWPKAKIG